MASEMTKESPEELDDLLSTDVFIRVKPAIEPKPSVLGRDGEDGDG